MAREDVLYADVDIIRLVETIIGQAIEKKASDIHFEPTESMLRVRYRIDGMLHDKESIRRDYIQQLVARIKVLSRIDIAEKRVPQDGKFRVIYDGLYVDLRVSTFPTIYGEKVVIRILDRSAQTIDVTRLGFSSDILNTFYALIQSAYGFLLVTGPTGSGKTTTLYSALGVINSRDKNIITLEDPVEYSLDGIVQGQIHEEGGFTFEKGIRALLRQDPDVVMIGEIRDKRTARIACEAALTGHLVLSTLHTQNAPGAIARLIDMGIEPFMMSAVLTGVLAQRLVRKICSHCCSKNVPGQKEKILCEQFGVDSSCLYYGKGCQECFYLGHKGRIGIFELLKISNSMRALMMKAPSFDEVQKQACDDGMKTLIADGREKVERGLITLEEFSRVVC